LSFDALTNSGLYQQQLTNFGTGLIRTASIYLKGTVGGENVMIGDASNRTRVVLTTDWVRYEGFASDDSTFFIIYTDHISGASSDIIDIAFAQYEQGLVATDYIETTTTTAQAGILEDMPRLDYSGGSCPALLLEPQRSNLCIQSEYAGSWSEGGTGSITDNDEISPEGKQNAFTLDDTSSGAYYRIERNVSVSAGDYTLSVFVKKTMGALSHYAGVQLDNNRKYVLIDTTNGTWNEAGSTANDFIDIEDFSSDYWRVIIRNNLSAGSIRVALWPALSTDGSTISVGATGQNTFYGIQLEQGSYPTSYIPTYGSSVTRSADVCIGGGDSSTFNSIEGVLYAEISSLSTNGNHRLISISDGTDTNRVFIGYFTGTGEIYAYVIAGSVKYNYKTNIANTEKHKIALKYKTNDFALWVDGVEINSSISGSTFASDTLNVLNFDSGLQPSVPFYGSVNSLIVFNTALTDDELAALTTL
jgi:hypothetical protein